jgi:hypothetical protein
LTKKGHAGGSTTTDLRSEDAVAVDIGPFPWRNGPRHCRELLGGVKKDSASDLDDATVTINTVQICLSISSQNDAHVTASWSEARRTQPAAVVVVVVLVLVLVLCRWWWWPLPVALLPPRPPLRKEKKAERSSRGCFCGGGEAAGGWVGGGSSSRRVMITSFCSSVVGYRCQKSPLTVNSRRRGQYGQKS